MKKFKRIAAAILVFCLVFMSGCGQKEETDPLKALWDEAQKHLFEKNYPEAAKAFDALGAYEEAPLYAVYTRAHQALQEEKYESAYLSFDGLGDFLDSSFAAKYAKAMHLMVLTQEDKECYLYAAEFFEQAPLYKDSIQRAEEARKNLYDAAHALLDAGDYTLSAHYFALLEAYSDSAMMEKYVYAAEKESYGMEDTAQYLLAVEAFEALSGYKDSEQRAKNVLETVYAEAEALFAAGKYEEAGQIYTLLAYPHDCAWGSAERDAYRDSESMIDYCVAHAQKASAGEDAGLLLSACEAFEKLTGVRESEACALEIREEIYQQGVQSLNAGEYDRAIGIFEMQREYSDSEEMISYASVCAFAAESSGTNAGMLEAAAAFEALNGFKDSSERAETFRSTVYAEAEKAFAEGKFAEAAEIFAMQDFGDNEKMVLYTQACALESAGETDDFIKIEAAIAFEALGDFKDCAARALALRESVYQKAEAALENGSYFAAIRLFTMQDYRDSKSMIEYVKAKSLEYSGDGIRAAKAYEELGEFKDSRERAQLLRGSVYEEAQTALSGNDFETAIELFASQDYLDSAEMIPYAEAMQLEYEGDRICAAQAYEKLGAFRESEAKAASLRGEVYDEAQTALTENDFETAIELFASQDYLDSVEMIAYANVMQMEHAGMAVEAAEGYEAMGGFRDSSERAASLREMVYSRACAALEADDFETAIELFASQDYLDSAQMVSYTRAVRLGYEGDGIGAAVAFENLSGFRDSSDRAESLREGVYMNALALFEEGKLQEARDMIALQKEYRDCEQMYAYISGLMFEAEGQLFAANEQYELIPGFRDTEERIGKNRKLSYNLAWTGFEAGEYEEAAGILEQLGDYEDSRQGNQYVQAVKALEDAGADAEVYVSVKAEFTSLGNYRDSEKYVETIDKLLFMRFVDEISVFSENGLAAFRKNGKWGFIDTEGNVVVNAQYDQVYAYSDGLAAVKLADKWGFIDESGRFVIERKYDLVRPFSNGMALVATRNDYKYNYRYIDKAGIQRVRSWTAYSGDERDFSGNFVYVDFLDCVFDKKGNEVSQTPLFFSEGISVYSKYLSYTYTYGYMDENGTILAEAQWDEARPFENGYAIVKKDGKYGLINRTGEQVINCVYDSVNTPQNGIARVSLNGKYGYISIKGNTVSAVQWAYAYEYSDRLALVWKNGYYGYIGTNGQTQIPFVWDEAKPFENGYAAVKQYGTWKFINTEGEIVLTLDKSVSNVKGSYTDPLIAVINETGSYGFCNHEGKVCVSYRYGEIQPFRDGIARVKRSGYYGFIDESGNEVIPCKYEMAKDFSCGVAWVREKSYTNYSLIDRSGKKIYNSNTSFDSQVFPFIDDVTFVYDFYRNNSYYYLLDKNGKKLTDAVYADVRDGMTDSEYEAEMEEYYAEMGVVIRGEEERTVSIPSLIQSGVFPSGTRFTVSKEGRILTYAGNCVHEVCAQKIGGVWYLLDKDGNVLV